MASVFPAERPVLGTSLTTPKPTAKRRSFHNRLAASAAVGGDEAG